MPKHITQKQKEEIVNYYIQKPITIKALATLFKISKPSAIKILNEYNIKRYSKVQLFSPELREDYFEDINCEAKAYFLGLIITDGCVHYTKGKQPLVGLSLKEEDEYLIEKFKTEICSNKLITHDGRGCSQLNILSQKMVEDLKQFDILANKSLNTKFPKNLPQQMYPHLIRGILDGDGSVSYYARQNRKSHTKAIRFCQGNKNFLQDMVNFFYDNLKIDKVSLYQEKESLWSIAYRKNISMIKIIDYIYKDANIYMKRKKQICDLIYAEACKYGGTEITNKIKKLIVS